MNSHEVRSEQIEHAAAIASDYEALQGLTSVGIGVGLLLTGLLPQTTPGLVLIAMSAAIGQGYYYKKYGRVRRNAAKVWAEFGVAVVLAISALVAIGVDRYGHPPILIGPLALAVGLLVMFKVNYRHVGTTMVHRVMLVALAVASFLPLSGLLTSASHWRVDLVLFGVTFIVIGVADHVRLTRAMRPVNHESH